MWSVHRKKTQRIGPPRPMPTLTVRGLCFILGDCGRDALFSVVLIWPDQVQSFRNFVYSGSSRQEKSVGVNDGCESRVETIGLNHNDKERFGEDFGSRRGGVHRKSHSAGLARGWPRGARLRQFVHRL